MSERPVYFVSDIHLNDRDQPQNALFLSFLNGPARSAQALYILGDLFEYWLGDDIPSEIANRVAASCQTLVATGIPVYFMPGNRDFLIGKAYAARAGFVLLPDSLVRNFWDRPILLHHGDTYCVSDTRYLKYRQWIQKRWLQLLFLSLPKKWRASLAARLRASSKAHTQSASKQIFHIPPFVITEAAAQAQVRTVIHGHIHQAIDAQYPLNNNHDVDMNTVQHLVLGEWGVIGSVIACTASNIELLSYDSHNSLSKTKTS
ncbi:MAG: UDP-2,3-diacylglucosamine diphosphatase [Methylocystaceae bacterium]|nr:UDP-2,3-diacylglucosamine diphosphatase [Methylocystaceae bacterium]